MLKIEMAFKIIIMMMEKLLDQPNDLPYSDIKKMASKGQRYRLKFNPNGGWIKACKHHDGWDSSVIRIGWVWEEWEQSNVSVHNNLVSHLEKVNLD